MAPGIYAGTFTNDLEQLHFIYVSGTEGAEAAFKQELRKHCPEGKAIYIEKHDPDWDQYLGFLYPNPSTIEYYGYYAKTNTSLR